MRYCITHEMFVKDNEPISELSGCLIAYSAPPEFEPLYNVVRYMVPPTEQELILMDMNAEVLEADFTGD